MSLVLMCIILAFNIPIISFILFLSVQVLYRYVVFHARAKVDEASIKCDKGSVPNCPPALVSYYINNKKLYLKGRVATLIDLITRGYIRVIKDSDSNDFNDWFLEVTEKSFDGLHKYELLILNLLKEKMDTKTVLKYLKGRGKYRSTLKEFENLVSNQEKSRFAYNNSKVISKERTIAKVTEKFSAVPACIALIKDDILVEIIGTVICFVVSIVWSIFFWPRYSGYFVAGVVFFFTLSCLCYYVLKNIQTLLLDINEYYSTFNVTTEEEYKKWINFKKALKKHKGDYLEIESVYTEYFYSYAIIFGCDQKVFKNSIKNHPNPYMLKYFRYLSKKVPNIRVMYRTLYKKVEVKKRGI